MNRLAKEKSAYLRHAAGQRIDWYPWGEEAFERAKREDKPVFLSSGAIWCHWCHVMANECFFDPGIADLLNENYISIKLDRDEMPHIDRRYQQAVAAMGSGGGWPLSVFLTPEKKPFFGGTYFPPEDRHDRPGFGKVLREVLRFFEEKKGDIDEYTSRLMSHLAPAPLTQSVIHESLINEAVEDILSEYDPQHGGFGSAPKFPMPGVLEFLIMRYAIGKSEAVRDVVKKTLDAMAKGGFHDQLQGGFHRYSTDKEWIIPHFEKMADDNAWLLKNYINAYSVFGDEYYRNVAEGIVDFLKDVLSAPEGGFFSSQDADVTPDDEGGYFTWKEEDLRKVLDTDEFGVLSRHLLDERGAMHHDASKKVLFVAAEAEDIGRELGTNRGAVSETIDLARRKLLKARNKRESPFVDRTLYASLNGMLISASLRAFRSLKDPWLKDFSLRSLERILKKYFTGTELHHAEGISGLLDDYVFLCEACIDAYEVTGNRPYLNTAEALMELCIKKMWDEEEGGFFDSEDAVLGLRLKGIEDIPHPSANAVSIILLMKLSFMTDKEAYHKYAERSLRAFSSRARDMGIHSGFFYSSLDAYFHMLTLTMETGIDSELTGTALSFLSPYTAFAYSENRGKIIPCIRGVCYEPVFSSESLRDFLANERFRE